MQIRTHNLKANEVYCYWESSHNKLTKQSLDQTSISATKAAAAIAIASPALKEGLPH